MLVKGIEVGAVESPGETMGMECESSDGPVFCCCLLSSVLQCTQCTSFVLCFFLRCNTASCICCDRLSSTFPFGYGRASVDCETPEEQASYKIKVWVEVAGCCKIKELSCLNKVN